MQNCTSLGLFASMGFQRRSFLIKALNSLPISGKAFTMGTELFHCAAYHPQTDGQTERVNQVLEDMLRACVLTYGKKWEICLPFVDFSYNNSYQASIEMSPFEALYGRCCRMPLNWSKSSERAFLSPNSRRQKNMF